MPKSLKWRRLKHVEKWNLHDINTREEAKAQGWLHNLKEEKAEFPESIDLAWPSGKQELPEWLRMYAYVEAAIWRYPALKQRRNIYIEFESGSDAWSDAIDSLVEEYNKGKRQQQKLWRKFQVYQRHNWDYRMV